MKAARTARAASSLLMAGAPARLRVALALVALLWLAAGWALSSSP